MFKRVRSRIDAKFQNSTLFVILFYCTKYILQWRSYTREYQKHIKLLSFRECEFKEEEDTTSNRMFIYSNERLVL